MGTIARNKFGERLIQLLQADKRDLKWLAEESGVSYQTIHHWVWKDKEPRPRPDLYARVIKALRISPSGLPISDVKTEEKPKQLELELLENIEANVAKLRGLLLMGCPKCRKRENED